MTNREKFKEVFGKDIKWSDLIEPQRLALKSAQINGIDCMEEWLNAEYEEPITKKCTTCAFREIDGKPHEMCKSCVCGDRYRQEPTTKNDLVVDSTPNTISFKEMTDNLKITAEDIENAEDLEYSIEPLIRPKNNLGVDCISRVDVNQVIEDYMDEQYHVLSDRTRERAFGAKAVKARINELQPVTSIRPKGHWIEERNDYGEIEHWHCSNCYDDSGFITTCKWDYCPNCGSDNREVAE